jgi:hypothetical protein
MILSSTKEDYMVASSTSCEAPWPHKLVAKLTDQMLGPTTVYYDNYSCVKPSENEIFHDHSKHIEMR